MIKGSLRTRRGDGGLNRPLIFVRASAAMLAGWLAGCAAFEVHNEPVNRPLAGNAAARARGWSR